MRILQTLLVALFIVSAITCLAQDANMNSLDSFSGKLVSNIRTNNKQRAYLVTDKSLFTSGESIWFKVFLLNNFTQKVNTKSKFLFVDIVNEKDKVVKLMIMDAAKQQLHSRLLLPDSLPEGYYWIRAYTRQMITGDTNGIAVKPIYIVSNNSDNHFIDTRKRSATLDSNLVFNLLPEGGSIMTGINTTIAFKASLKNGLPLAISGYLKDNRDTIITRFNGNSYGMGKFEFEPSRFRRYTAVVNWHGKDISYPLPPFNFFAGQLSALDQQGAFKFRILLEDSIYKKNFETYLVGICRDSMVFASIGRGLYEVTVDKQKLPEGVTTFFLFDKNFKKLSERSVYVHDNGIHVKISTDKTTYGKKDKVTMNVSIVDAAQTPAISLLAVSVSDIMTNDLASKYPMNDIGRTGDDLLLSLNDGLKPDDADLVMMTRQQEYELLNKSNTLNGTADNAADSLLYIKGVVHNEKNQPYANTILTLFSNSGDAILYSDTTNSAGRFRFPVDYYRDSTQFAIEIRDLKGTSQKAAIDQDELKYPSLNTPASMKTYLTLPVPDMRKYLNTYRDEEALLGGKMLPRVTVVEKRKLDYDQTKRQSMFSSIISQKDLPEGAKVGDALLKIAGMHMLNGYLVINGLTSMGDPNSGSEPILLVEGAQVNIGAEGGETSPVLSYLNNLSPKDVDFIEVLKGPEAANYGMHGGNGVILVNLLAKRRDLDASNNSMKIFYAKGVSHPALFSNTDYQKKDPKAPVITDRRSTLFWNGGLLTDKSSNAVTLTFYTSDIPATYKVVVTGITAHGDIIYKTINFQSK